MLRRDRERWPRGDRLVERDRRLAAQDRGLNGRRRAGYCRRFEPGRGRAIIFLAAMVRHVGTADARRIVAGVRGRAGIAALVAAMIRHIGTADARRIVAAVRGRAGIAALV